MNIRILRCDFDYKVSRQRQSTCRSSVKAKVSLVVCFYCAANYPFARLVRAVSPLGIAPLPTVNGQEAATGSCVRSVVRSNRSRSFVALRSDFVSSVTDQLRDTKVNERNRDIQHCLSHDEKRFLHVALAFARTFAATYISSRARTLFPRAPPLPPAVSFFFTSFIVRQAFLMTP